MPVNSTIFESFSFIFISKYILLAEKHVRNEMEINTHYSTEDKMRVTHNFILLKSLVREIGIFQIFRFSNKKKKNCFYSVLKSSAL